MIRVTQAELDAVQAWPNIHAPYKVGDRFKSGFDGFFLVVTAYSEQQLHIELLPYEVIQ